MKVAFVANTCWNIYNFRKRLVLNFLEKGDTVIVLAPHDEYTNQIENWGVRWIETPVDGTGSNPINDLIYLRKVFSVFRKEKPDVVLSYTIKSNIYSCLAGSIRGIPVICNVSGLGTVFLVKGIAGKLAIKLYKVAFKFADYVFFQNVDDKELFSSHIKLKNEKTGLLPGSGIDLEGFSPKPFNPKKKVKFLMISRLIIEKGVCEYAEAASLFSTEPNAEFTLVGKFDDTHARSIQKTELENWINKGWIRYFPHTNEIERLIEEHEVVVLPSYREGTPRTLLEGAALGKPLLASNVPGCKEVVKDGYNGFLFEAQSPTSLVDKIRLYMSLNDDEKRELSINSRKLVEEKFDEQIVINSYNAAIHLVLVGM